MPVHFAASCSNPYKVLTRLHPARGPLNAANDNAGRDGSHGADGERLLRAALRHFAEYGLSAAERAREFAEAAFFAGDSDKYRQWMAICATLDRRMPAAAAFHRNSFRG